MEDKLIEILSQYDYPVILQGSLAQGEEYPEHFFTYWQNPGDDSSFYDNKAHCELYDYDVNFYSTDAALVYKMPVTVKQFYRAGNGLLSRKRRAYTYRARYPYNL